MSANREPSLWGALFDWDGVVIDSSSAHRRSWEMLAEEERLNLPLGHFEAGFGRRNTDLIPHILGWSDDLHEISRLGDRKEELYREIIRAEGIEPLPGAAELIAWLREQAIPRAVGTSTPRANVEAVLEVIGLEGAFDTIVAAEDVRHGKPDPEVFLAGAKGLQLPPAKCVVFEDSFHGLEAGRAGGMFVVGVGTTHPQQELTPVDLAVHRLSDLDFAQLDATMRAR